MKDAKQLASHLALSLRNAAELPEDVCNDIAFHTTDWLDEMQSLYKTFENIESLSDEEIYNNLLKFFIHAPEHIVRATELMTGTEIERIFSGSSNE